MAGLQTAFNSNTYRIVEYCLLKFYKTNNITNFKYLEYTDERPNPTVFKHYISPENQSDIEQAVWTDGEYAHRINKVYDSLPLLTPTKNYETNSSIVSVVLKQGFSWTDVFGIHVLIKGTLSKDIYVSKVLFIDDFKINDNKELIQGSFWFEQSDILIPRTDEILACQITTIKYSDIQADGPSIGYIYNYPEFLEPLIAEKPIPDFIQTNLDIDVLSNYIKIKPITTENKSLEKSILDYFGQTTADISIEHVVRFGNDEDGYQSLRVSNEHNMFGEVTLGLDFTQFEKSNSYDDIIEELKSGIFKEVFDELTKLRKEKAELLASQIIDRKTIKDLQDTITIKLNKIAELEVIITALNIDIVVLNNKLEVLQTSFDIKSEQFDLLTQEHNQLTINYNRVINELEIANEEIVELNKVINDINDASVLLNNRIIELNNELIEVKNTVLELRETIVLNNTEISSLRETILIKDSIIDILVGEKNNLQQLIDEATIKAQLINS